MLSLKNWNDQYAIYRGSGEAQYFGLGYDLHISSNAGFNRNSYARPGNTYQNPPGYIYNRPNTNSLLAGSFHFTPSEVEVLY